MTGVLVDTHVLLWWADCPEQLSEEARLAIALGHSPLYLSDASLWELNIKISMGKLTLPRSTNELMMRARVNSLPIRRSHIDGILELPFHHRDPFDRLLIAQARSEKLKLVTRDANIHKYDVQTITA